jgi:hypothetical protein
MQQILINLKQRIDKNHKQIHRKCLLTKPILGMINQLIDNKASKEEIIQWLDEYESPIFIIEEHLKIIEEK